MFTGIIEEIGIVKGFSNTNNGANLTVECFDVLSGTKIGDSIAINGVCQTVIEMNSTSFKTNISTETLKITKFSGCKIGDKLNLERALTLSQRLGGHVVTGHIDCSAKFVKKEPMTFEVAGGFEKYIVKKGSVTVDGVSLTVSDIVDNTFSIAVIPHTLGNTTFKDFKIGDIVNIETDIFAKYVEKILLKVDNKTRIDSNFLEDNGFL